MALDLLGGAGTVAAARVAVGDLERSGRDLEQSPSCWYYSGW